MAMSAAQAQRIDDLFRRAVALAPPERSDFLAEACEDANLRAEVEDLLKHDEQTASDFLMPPGVVRQESQPSQHTNQPDPLVDINIGSCRIVARLGMGGMGTVYKALQRQPRRSVAVKIMHTR